MVDKIPDNKYEIISNVRKLEFEYLNGMLNGYYRKYFKNLLILEIPYLNNKKQGIGYQYYNYPEKKILAKVEFNEDFIDGVVEIYYLNGNLSRQSVYKKNLLLRKKDYYDDGTEFISSCPIKGKFYQNINISLDFYDNLHFTLKQFSYF